MNILIKNARVCDPLNGIDERRDFCIVNGRISEKPDDKKQHYAAISGKDIIVTPGLIDIHAHFREPGDEDSETLQTGSMAAARGGFTHVVTMPNTNPPIDTPELIQETIRKSNRTGLNILPAACATAGRHGTGPADLKALSSAGAAAFTDDGSAVTDLTLTREILASSASLNKPFMQHAVDPEIAQSGVIRDCTLARERSLPVFRPEAESSIVASNIDIAAQTGGLLHLQHISTKESVNLLRSASTAGLSAVTSEVTPHHLAFCTNDISGNDSNFKMNPPLGTAADREALLAGLVDGTITCLATDHAPHSAKKKQGGFEDAAFGIIGLETAASVTYDILVGSSLVSLSEWVSLWTVAPAQIICIKPPSLEAGATANASVFRIGKRTITGQSLASKSSNCPFLGSTSMLDPVLTICNGIETWRSPDC